MAALLGLCLPAAAQEAAKEVASRAPRTTHAAKLAPGKPEAELPFELTPSRPAATAHPTASGPAGGQPQDMTWSQARAVARIIAMRTGNSTVVLEPPVQPSSLVRGTYADALTTLDEATRTMKTSEDIDAAMKAIDDATKALMQARAALCKQRDARAKKPARGPTTERGAKRE